MFPLTRSLLSVIAVAALPAGHSAGQPPEPEDGPQAAQTLCPMPVAPVRESDRSGVFRPSPGIRYHIRTARVPCHNPLFARPDEPVLAAAPKAPGRDEELERRRQKRQAAARSSETPKPAAAEDGGRS